MKTTVKDLATSDGNKSIIETESSGEMKVRCRFFSSSYMTLSLRLYFDILRIWGCIKLFH